MIRNSLAIAFALAIALFATLAAGLFDPRTLMPQTRVFAQAAAPLDRRPFGFGAPGVLLSYNKAAARARSGGGAIN